MYPPRRLLRCSSSSASVLWQTRACWQPHSKSRLPDDGAAAEAEAEAPPPPRRAGSHSRTWPSFEHVTKRLPRWLQVTELTRSRCPSSWATSRGRRAPSRSAAPPPPPPPARPRAAARASNSASSSAPCRGSAAPTSRGTCQTRTALSVQPRATKRPQGDAAAASTRTGATGATGTAVPAAAAGDRAGEGFSTA